MKGRKLLLIAILGIITVTLAIGTYLDYQGYQQWMQRELTKYPTEIQPYIDFQPYFASSRGRLWITFSAVVYGVFGLAAMLQRIKR